jgi:hypothetical protein
MSPEMDVRRIIELTRTIDALKPSLNEVIAAQVQSLAGAISATTDLGPTRRRRKEGKPRLLNPFDAAPKVTSL